MEREREKKKGERGEEDGEKGGRRGEKGRERGVIREKGGKREGERGGKGGEKKREGREKKEKRRILKLYLAVSKEPYWKCMYFGSHDLFHWLPPIGTYPWCRSLNESTA